MLSLAPTLPTLFLSYYSRPQFRTLCLNSQSALHMIFQKAYFDKGCQGPLESYHKGGGTKVGFTQEQSNTTGLFTMSLSYFKLDCATSELRSNITQTKEFVLQACSYFINLCVCHEDAPPNHRVSKCALLGFQSIAEKWQGVSIHTDTVFTFRPLIPNRRPAARSIATQIFVVEEIS